MDLAKFDTLELIRTFLPKYLTPEQKDNLFNLVQNYFPFTNDPNIIYSFLQETDYYYQGDCVIDIPFAKFDNGKFEAAYLKGIIASNTCDISQENERIESANIQFSTVFTLSEYIEILKRKSIPQIKINTFLENLKCNRISNLFYLPEKIYNGEKVLEESFARFDSNVTLPISIFNDTKYNKSYSPNGDRVFSFSNYGFYMFLIKLSVHYCRFREGVFRDN